MSTLLQHDQYGDVHAGDQILFSSLSAGSTVLVLIQRVSGTGSITGCSDPVNGAYTSLGSFGTCYGFVKRNILAVVSGSVTAVSSDGVSTIWLSQGYEIVGPDNVAAILTGNLTDEGPATNHVLYTPGLSGTGFYAGISEFDVSSDWAPGSGWINFNTLVSASGATQYKIETGVSETGPYTTVGSIIGRFTLLVFIPDTVIPPPSGLPFITQIGAKRI